MDSCVMTRDAGRNQETSPSTSMQSHAVCVRRCGGSLLDRVQSLIEIYEVDHVGFVSQSREYVVAVSSGPDKWT